MRTIKATLQASQLRMWISVSDEWTTLGVIMPRSSAVARQGSCASSQEYAETETPWCCKPLNTNIPTLVIHGRCRGMKDLWYGKTHVEFRQSQFIHDIWQLDDQKRGKFISQRHFQNTACWILPAQMSSYPDLAELHLDLFGDNIGPVLLSQEVPEYPSQKSVHPGLGLHRLFWTPANLRDRVKNSWDSAWGKSNLSGILAKKILSGPIGIHTVHLLCSIDKGLTKLFDRSCNSVFFFYCPIRVQQLARATWVNINIKADSLHN